MRLVESLGGSVVWKNIEGIAIEMGGKTGGHETFFVGFGKRVRGLREARGWSLRDMVVLHGYHASQWQVFEKGSNVTLDSVLRMATVFDLTLAELLGDLAEFPQKYSDQNEAGTALATVPLGSSASVKGAAEVKSAKAAQKKTSGK